MFSRRQRVYRKPFRISEIWIFQGLLLPGKLACRRRIRWKKAYRAGSGRSLSWQLQDVMRLASSWKCSKKPDTTKWCDDRTNKSNWGVEALMGAYNESSVERTSKHMQENRNKRNEQLKLFNLCKDLKNILDSVLFWTFLVRTSNPEYYMQRKYLLHQLTACKHYKL